MSTRKPAVAGQFYPSSPEECRSEVAARLEGGGNAKAAPQGRLVGGIVPHAGWICSGTVAGEVIAAFRDAAIDTFIVFGAVHRLSRPQASVDARGDWQTPLGTMTIDEQLAAAVLDVSSDLLADDAQSHLLEHSIEVQLPFLQAIQPEARLLPVGVPPIDDAPAVGTIVAEQVNRLGRRVAFLGSSDLTHYGPRYGFMPAGTGRHALHWAKANDRRIIELCLKLQAECVVSEARTHCNACGSGAIAATLAAARASGANEGMLLRHTSSAEVLRDQLGSTADAVGYAGILLHGTQSAPNPGS